MDYEKTLEHYLQGHFHPDVAPQVRREVKLGTVSIEGFLRLANIFDSNHRALDSDNVTGEVAGIPQLERTDCAQLDFRFRVVDL